MQGWRDFYEIVAGASATLLGLLFVSVSINAAAILGEQHGYSRRLAEQAFQNYLCVLVVSLMVFYPGINSVIFGNVVFWTAGIWGSWSAVRAFQTFRNPPPNQSLLRRLRRYSPSLLGFALLIYSCVLMIVRRDGSGFAAAGVLLLLLSATIVSWDLLIQIGEQR